MEVETALVELGSYSRWQLEKLSAFSLLLFVMFPFQLFANVFQAWTPVHECQIPSNYTRNQSIPYTIKDGKQVFDQCHLYKFQSSSDDVIESLSNNTIEHCDKFIYKSDGYETLITQFDLVCNEAHLPALSQSFFFCGHMLGGLVFGFCSDMFGRKYVAIVTAILCGMTSLTSLAISSFTPYIAIRFFVGFFTYGTSLSTVAISSELLPSKQRAFAISFLFIFWPIGMTLLSLVSFLFKNWHHLVIFISLSTMLLAILAIWLTEESIPWLVSNGKGDRAIEILKKAARKNGVTFSEDTLRNISEAASRCRFNHSFTLGSQGIMTSFHKRLRDLKEDLKNKFCCFKKEQPSNEIIGYRTIFNHRSLRCWTLTSMSIWFNLNLMYYGLSLSSSSFVGNRFINFFLMSIVEPPAYLLTIFPLERIGRRYTIMSSFILTGVFLLAAIVVPKQVNGLNIEPVTTVFNMLGKFFIALAYCAVYTHTQEYYPTNIRTRGLGLSALAASFGAILSPFCGYIASIFLYISSHKAKFITGILTGCLARYSKVTLAIILGSLAVVNGMLTLLLPETRNKPLPKDMEDIDRLGFIKFGCSKKEDSDRCDKLETAPMSTFDDENV